MPQPPGISWTRVIVIPRLIAWAISAAKGPLISAKAMQAWVVVVVVVAVVVMKVAVAAVAAAAAAAAVVVVAAAVVV